MIMTRRVGRIFTAALATMLLAISSSASAVTMPWVTVGDAGNADDIHDVGFGGVAYEYNISKHEVTHAQYVEFLDAHATVGDPLALFNDNMSTSKWGGIVRTGTGTALDPWDYDVKAPALGRAPGGGDYYYDNKPVAWTSWYDAIRFANWMHNGQGSGDTESGAYTILGGTPIPSNGTSITRNPEAEIFLSSEDEWYKAAYYDPNKAGGAGYYLYPNGSDIAPDNNLPSADSGNSASWGGAGSPDNWNYPLTDVGAYPLSVSPYGTSDQAGSVYEWVETLVGGNTRRHRGGFWGETGPVHMESTDDTHYREGEYEHAKIGFRLASLVPAPVCVVGDASCDGYVDVGGDIFPAFENFTGPGSFGMTRAQGDVQGNATGATANLDPHDGDVDVSDIITMFSNFTGPAPPSDEAGGLVAAEALDSTIPDLIYDASTGEVLLDLDSAVGFTGYVLNSANGFITGNHTPFMAGVTTTLPYELAEATFGTPAGPYPKSIGNVFPSGMDMAALSAFLTGNQVSRGNNQPIVPFDLVIVNPVSSGVPEPAAVVMGIMALAGLASVAYRRRNA